MPRLLFFYLSKRIAIASLYIAAGLCIPVVMTSLFHYLPPAAIRGGLLMPALLGTLPTVLYIALPMAVGVAVALEFARMSADGMIAVLYSLRLSVWAITLPAAFVALVAVGAGYWLSSVFAPAHVGEMHDVIYVIRNSLNHRMLEPAQFYSFDNGARTLYFRRWLSADVASGMFVYQFSAEKNEEQIITAAKAEFRRNANGVVLIMSNGSIETLPMEGSTIRTAHFDEYAMPIGMQGSGGLPQRSWRGVFELPFLEFFHERPSTGHVPAPLRRVDERGRQAVWHSLSRPDPCAFRHRACLEPCFGKRPLFGGNNRDHARDPNDPCRNSRFRRNAGASGSALHLCWSGSRSSWNLPPPCF